MNSESAVIDLMSDARTKPSQAMRVAMANAIVGDDSFGDDPTVHELERRFAELSGKEAALFTCGGTMSNLLAVLSRPTVGPVMAGRESHIYFHEFEGPRQIARAELVPIADGPFGAMDINDLSRALRSSRDRPALVCLENTSTRLGGAALESVMMEACADAAHASGASVHLDGARLPNASAALGVPMSDLGRYADTVAIGLDKGLGAPVGSVLCGSRSRISRCRDLRRMVGGTMHQTGILAAAGLVAIGNLGRLLEDHRRAERLRKELALVDRLEVLSVPVPTNLIMVRRRGLPAEELVQRFADAGVLGLPLTGEWVRFVLHLEHDESTVDEAASRCAIALSQA